MHTLPPHSLPPLYNFTVREPPSRLNYSAIHIGRSSFMLYTVHHEDSQMKTVKDYKHRIIKMSSDHILDTWNHESARHKRAESCCSLQKWINSKKYGTNIIAAAIFDNQSKVDRFSLSECILVISFTSINLISCYNKLIEFVDHIVTLHVNPTRYKEIYVHNDVTNMKTIENYWSEIIP